MIQKDLGKRASTGYQDAGWQVSVLTGFILSKHCFSTYLFSEAGQLVKRTGLLAKTTRDSPGQYNQALIT